MKWSKLTLPVLLALMLVAPGLSTALAQDEAPAPTVSLNPPVASAGVGETVTLKVDLANALGANAAQVSLIYPTNLLEPVPAPGGEGPLRAGSVFADGEMVVSEVVPEEGKVTVVVVDPGTESSMSGNGDLFSVSFRTLAEGLATVTITEGLVAMPVYDDAGVIQNSNEISATLESGTVSIGGRAGGGLIEQIRSTVTLPIALGASLIFALLVALAIFLIGRSTRRRSSW